MASQAKQRFTPEEYLALEREADYKSEYLSGEIFAITRWVPGASYRHNLIVANVVIGLGGQLQGGPCRVVASDLRVRVNATGLYTYPDAIVICGEARFGDDHRDTLLNPAVVIEVLSSSTEAYDRGEKFAHYRRLESLQDYVLIAQDRHRIEHYARHQNQQWLLTEAGDLAHALPLTSIGCDLALREVYDQVTLPNRDEPETA